MFEILALAAIAWVLFGGASSGAFTFQIGRRYHVEGRIVPPFPSAADTEAFFAQLRSGGADGFAMRTDGAFAFNTGPTLHTSTVPLGRPAAEVNGHQLIFDKVTPL